MISKKDEEDLDQKIYRVSFSSEDQRSRRQNLILRLHNESKRRYLTEKNNCKYFLMAETLMHANVIM